jgi:hypothetical protein
MALSRRDASIVMGMLARGDHNQDIAAWFGENPARIVEVENGTMFGSVPAAPANELPPKGAVGPKARRLRAYAVDALKALKEKGSNGVETAIKELEEGVKRFDQHEP